MGRKEIQAVPAGWGQGHLICADGWRMDYPSEIQQQSIPRRTVNTDKSWDTKNPGMFTDGASSQSCKSTKPKKWVRWESRLRGKPTYRCYNLNDGVLPRDLCGNLTSQTKGGNFGRWWSHKGFTFINKTGALIKRLARAHSTVWGHNKTSILEALTS